MSEGYKKTTVGTFSEYLNIFIVPLYTPLFLRSIFLFLKMQYILEMSGSYENVNLACESLVYSSYHCLSEEGDGLDFKMTLINSNIIT